MNINSANILPYYSKLNLELSILDKYSPVTLTAPKTSTNASKCGRNLDRSMIPEIKRIINKKSKVRLYKYFMSIFLM